MDVFTLWIYKYPFVVQFTFYACWFYLYPIYNAKQFHGFNIKNPMSVTDCISILFLILRLLFKCSVILVTNYYIITLYYLYLHLYLLTFACFFSFDGTLCGVLQIPNNNAKQCHGFNINNPMSITECISILFLILCLLFLVEFLLFFTFSVLNV